MKKKNRDLILEYLEQNLINGGKGASTSVIADDLQMQRTNVSKLLNLLIKEGFVEKTQNSYPILYKRTSLNFSNDNILVFKSLIGHDRSLKRPIYLAKSAVLYPNHPLNILVLGNRGSGKSLFVRKIYEFALEKGVLSEDCGFVKLNCIYYKDDLNSLRLRFQECVEKAKKGFLFIDNIQLLDSKSKSDLSTIIDNDNIVDTKEDRIRMIVCAMPPVINTDIFFENITSKITIVIELPNLQNRGLKERFDFIHKFFCDETDASSCDIRVSSEILIALLLYPCDNIKQLFNDIRQACASAYVRDKNSNASTINVLMSDFPQEVRLGLLTYKNMQSDIDAIIQNESEYVFSKKDLTILGNKNSNKNSIYNWINNKRNELFKKGFSLSDTNTIISAGLETEINKYKQNAMNMVVDKKQLSQLVDSKIITMVEEFLDYAGKSLNRYFPMSVHHGLCLHLQTVLSEKSIVSNFKAGNVIEFIEKHRDEYSLAMAFTDKINLSFDVELPIEETIIITTFLYETVDSIRQNNKPSLLLAMHGAGVAKALADTLMMLTDVKLYYYDLSLNKKPIDAFDDIKRVVLNIPHENGILVLYDMGSLKDIFNMIAMETAINIKTVEMPFILQILDICRKLMITGSIDELYQVFRKDPVFSFDSEKAKKYRAIITFCMTGEGGALETKKYIEKKYDLEDIEIIPLQLKEQSLFLQELNTISKDKEIICLIGTFNPNIYGIPYIPIENVFKSENYALGDLLNKDHIIKQDFINNSEIIIQHLSSDLKNIDVIKIKNQVINFVTNLEDELKYSIDMNVKIGLLVHVVCMLDRLKGGNDSGINPFKKTIIEHNLSLYRTIVKELSVFEKELDVNVSDDEICNIISILKKTR